MNKVYFTLIALITLVLISGCAQEIINKKTPENTTEQEKPIQKDSQIPLSECISDSDCVPSSCCHSDNCVPKDKSPACKGIFCTQECVPATLDCQQGSCKCQNNKCIAVIY
jgi:LAS superfamily LD-carboxypeptidase LdcB